MQYLKVDWRHDHPDEPISLYSECDDAGWEKRKVEVFRDGRFGCAGIDGDAAGSRLGTEPLPGLDAIAQDPAFRPVRITQAEFERAWAAAQTEPARRTNAAL